MKKIFARLQLVALSTLWLVLPPAVSAQMVGPQAWKGDCVAKADVVPGGVATIQGLRCMIANILSVAITAIGFAGFLMLIIGGFRYLTSGGNSKGTETAKNTITFAVIGLVVALSSFVILNLIAEFTGVKTILQFVIPSAGTTI
ncbi:hypothetical protein KJ654_02440 [Patescibacteria group bacterium]|nr:hypothetical protein [Patescibacteria group bacterium]